MSVPQVKTASGPITLSPLPRPDEPGERRQGEHGAQRRGRDDAPVAIGPPPILATYGAAIPAGTV